MKARTGNHSRRGNGFFDLFKSKTTYRPGATKHALSAAYKAGERAGDTGEFDNWWNRYSNKSGVDKQKAKREFERGVEGQPSTEKVVAKKATGIRGKYRGCNIYFDPESKEYFGSCDRDSKFDSYQQVKGHIDWLKKGREENPKDITKTTIQGIVSYVPESLQPLLRVHIDLNDSSTVDREFIEEIVSNLKKLNQPVWVAYGETKARIFTTHKSDLSTAMSYAKKRKNPDGKSVLEITEGFHGRPSEDETEILEEETYSEELAGLGLLCELEICDSEDSDKVVPIKFDYSKPENVVILACDKNGNIELVGGDQDLEIDELEKQFGTLKDGDGKPHNKVKLGYVHSISYFADKHHLEGPKYQAKGTEYVHEFGEEGGDKPCLIYDFRNKKIELVGGSYTITDEGIRN